MTKKEFGMLWSWYYSNDTQLSDVYKTWSSAKQAGYDYCLRRQKALDGFSGRICGANGWQFSYAFLFHLVNTKTGVVETWLEYHTANHCYHFMVTDESDYMEVIHDFFEVR